MHEYGQAEGEKQNLIISGQVTVPLPGMVILGELAEQVYSFPATLNLMKVPEDW